MAYVRSRSNFFVPLFLDPLLMTSERLKRPSLLVPLIFVSKKIVINNILLFGYSIGRQGTAIQAYALNNKCESIHNSMYLGVLNFT